MEKPFSAYSGDEPYIFVCYAHDDAALVYPEINRLRESGFRIWYDEGISPGSEWSESLAEHIEGCAKFLYFVTPRSVEREHCRREINFALDQSCSILSVHLEETQLPSAMKLNLGHRQAILKYQQQRNQYEARLDQALKTVNPTGSRNSHKSRRGSDSSAQNSMVSARSSRMPLMSLILLMIVFSILFAWWYLGQQGKDANTIDKTIAIAPVEILSSDQRMDEFAKEIEVGLAHALSDGSNEQIQLIQAPALADFVLQGRLQTNRNATRLYFEVIRSLDGAVLWSKTLTEPYDQEKPAAFTQAGYLATMTRLVVGLETATEIETGSLEARSQYVMGLVEWLEITQGFGGDLGASIAYLQRAIDLDPQFVEPIRQMGIHYRNRFQLSLGYPEVIEQAHDYARRVISLRPDETFLLGTINSSLDLDYRAALANLEHARRHGWPIGEVESEIGQLLLTQGKLEQSVGRLETAMSVGAITNRTVAKLHIARAYLAAGRYQESKEATHESVSLSQGTELIHLASLGLQVSACYYTGDLAAANEALDVAWTKYGAERPEFFPGNLALLGRVDLARRVLKDSEDRYQRGELPVASESFWGHFYLGNVDDAMIWLGRAIENREFWFFPMLRRSEILNDIREDPRFMRAMNRLAEIESTGTPTKSVAYP